MLASSVFKALAAHFTDYVVFNTNDADIVIIASNGRRLNQLDPAILVEPKLQAQLQRVGLRSLADLQVRRIGDKALLHPLFLGTGAPANSDFFPYISLNAPRSRYLREDATELTQLGQAPIPVLEMLDGHARANDLPTAVTTHFPIPEFQHQARQFAEFLMMSATTTPPENLGENGWVLQLLARELAINAPLAPADTLMRGVLLKLASAVNPYLPTSRLAPLWEYLAGQPGFSALSETTQTWFALHRAVGLRDATAMAALAARLIETTPKEQLSAQEGMYLLTAGLTGALAKGDKNQANAILEMFGQRQNPVNQPPLYLQLLLRQM